MPQVLFTSKYKINGDLVMSPEELISRYFFGIPLEHNGQRIPDESIAFYIKAAQDKIEDELQLKLQPRVIKEDLDYKRKDWAQWGYAPVSYPVHETVSLEGFFNESKQITYPPDWMSSRKSNDGKVYFRQIFIVPSGKGTPQISAEGIYYNHVMPHVGLLGLATIPNYWRASYCTGWGIGSVPTAILETIGKMASIGLFNQLGDIILGGAAIASQRIQLDGLSESINTTLSAENSGYSARIRMYVSELKDTMPALKRKYLGTTVMAI
jgi:hypothetical protein